MNTYTETKFTFPEMKGISQKQLDAHLGLYAGYVKNLNVLREKIEELKTDSLQNALALSELTRRIAFEWNGMRLHEYYFENLGGSGAPTDAFVKKVEEQWSSYDAWKNEFVAIGMMRGIGWVLLCIDEKTKIAFNVW
jgi:Fe-Mn family superoxide dismutase